MCDADGLVKRLEELEKTAELYKGLFYNLRIYDVKRPIDSQRLTEAV